MAINYEEIVQDALRQVVKTVLTGVKKDGLSGNHHLYITFQTHFKGVEMADYLKERHPEEVTIVLQYQFWDLEVTDEYFSVTLSFSDVKENIKVPFGAITGFVDPSVKFGLQFTPQDELPVVKDETEEPMAAKPKPNVKSKKKPETKEKSTKKKNKDDGSRVVSLDAFRKKK